MEQMGWHDLSSPKPLAPAERVHAAVRGAFPHANWLPDDLGDAYLRWGDMVGRRAGLDPADFLRSTGRLLTRVGPLRGFRLNVANVEVLGVVRRDLVALATSTLLPPDVLAAAGPLTSALGWGEPTRFDRPTSIVWPWFPPV